MQWQRGKHSGVGVVPVYDEEGTASQTFKNRVGLCCWRTPQVGYECEMVLLFDCPDEVMLQRLRHRDEGRPDDNEETIRKRVHVSRRVQGQRGQAEAF